MAGFGEAFDQIGELVLDSAMVTKLIIELDELTLSWQLTFEQQPTSFLEAAMARQLLDRNSSILQLGPFAIDITYGRLGHRNVG
jgi:hypothetical protein